MFRSRRRIVSVRVISIPAERLVYETHMHTPLCNHAQGTPEMYAEVAHRRGLKGIIVTCHNPLPDGYAQMSRMRPEQFEQYQEMVREASLAMADRVEVRLGLEADYVPGLENWIERQLSSAPFDYVLGSVHPQIREYRDAYWTGDAFEYQRIYFDQLAAAAETGLYDCLSHPDLVKNIAPEEWNYSRIEEYLQRSLDRIASTGVAMELNTSGLNKAVPEMNPGPSMLREMRERDIPVVVGADAHVPERVADNYGRAYEALLEAGYDEVSYFLGRERATISIRRARSSLDREKATTLPD